MTRPLLLIGKANLGVAGPVKPWLGGERRTRTGTGIMGQQVGQHGDQLIARLVGTLTWEILGRVTGTSKRPSQNGMEAARWASARQAGSDCQTPSGSRGRRFQNCNPGIT
jgi:hypothetical protein